VSGPLAFRFDHVHFYCSDVAATERWFVEGLGAEVIELYEAGGSTTHYLRLGDTVLAMRQRRAGESMAEPGRPQLGADHFGLLVDDLDATAAELKRRGVKFTRDPQPFRPGVRIAFILGPDNVSIELMERKG